VRRKKRVRDSVTVRVPEAQPPFFHVPGDHGGWFVSLLWAFGGGVKVRWEDLRELLAMRDGSVMFARRLTKSEERLLLEHRQLDGEVHGRLIRNERMRFGAKGRK